MLESLKIVKPPKRNRSGRVKILLSIDREVLRDLSKMTPRSVNRQEAIRQIVEAYVIEKSLF